MKGIGRGSEAHLIAPVLHLLCNSSSLVEVSSADIQALKGAAECLSWEWKKSALERSNDYRSKLASFRLLSHFGGAKFACTKKYGNSRWDGDSCMESSSRPACIGLNERVIRPGNGAPRFMPRMAPPRRGALPRRAARDVKVGWIACAWKRLLAGKSGDAAPTIRVAPPARCSWNAGEGLREP